MVSVSICSPTSIVAAEWNDLTTRASANAFMNPAALAAADETKFARVHVLLAWDQSTEPRKLVGVWALQVTKIASFWPAVLEALPYNYAFLSSPVIDPSFAEEVIPAFFAALGKHPKLPNVIHLRSFDRESPSFQFMQREFAIRRAAQLTFSSIQRPFVTREFGIKRSGSTRKKLRQDWNRLSALGTVDLLNDRTAQGAQQAFEIFLALEAGSWKGAYGTALLCDRKDAAFVRRLVAGMSERGDASVALLRVDGRPIAAQVLMYCGKTAYTWKTAFDSEYARYSPGALLIDKVAEQLFSTSEIEAIDSCSVESSFMAQLWAGRRTVTNLLVDIGSYPSPAFVLEATRQLGYLWLKLGRDWLRAHSLVPRRKKTAVPATPQTVPGIASVK